VGYDELFLGRWEQARRHLEQAVKLDPRSRLPVHALSLVFRFTRHYPEAVELLDRALEFDPADLTARMGRVKVALAQGDLAGARAIIKATPKEIGHADLVAFIANNEDLMWVLDQPQQSLLLQTRPSDFDDDRAVWALVLAQTHALQGSASKTRAYADSARLAFGDRLTDATQDADRHAGLGLALAYLGLKPEAIQEGQRAVAIIPVSRDAGVGPYLQHRLARIYLLVGEPAKALDQLEPLLRIPYSLSPGWLKIDPNFAPLRGNPRFERLVNGQ
jgi:serine/threonine-protein kinase